MISFPHAKINLGLQVVEKRHDGFHNINTCFYPIGWSDVLEIVESENLSFESTGLPIPGQPEQNLCLQAYHLVKQDFNVPEVRMHLHKVIPMGAGLGGGSADGAFTLKMLNQLFDLGLSTKQLQSYAGQLGSDCPFFIEGKPVLASGKGDEFRACTLRLPPGHLLVVYPPVAVSTAQAYGALTPTAPPVALEQVLADPQTWNDKLTNDFESVVLVQHPEIAQLKQLMKDLGAHYCAMSGSGSAVFGLFEDQPDLQKIPSSYAHWSQICCLD